MAAMTLRSPSSPLSPPGGAPYNVALTELSTALGMNAKSKLYGAYVPIEQPEGDAKPRGITGAMPGRAGCEGEQSCEGGGSTGGVGRHVTLHALWCTAAAPARAWPEHTPSTLSSLPPVSSRLPGPDARNPSDPDS